MNDQKLLEMMKGSDDSMSTLACRIIGERGREKVFAFFTRYGHREKGTSESLGSRMKRNIEGGAGSYNVLIFDGFQIHHCPGHIWVRTSVSFAPYNQYISTTVILDLRKTKKNGRQKTPGDDGVIR